MSEALDDNIWDWWTITSLILFYFVMFGLGSSLEFYEFKQKIKKPKGIIIGIISQFIFMPFICFILSHLFDLDTNSSIGMILIGCCPGGALSNTLAYIFQTDITLSIAMTTCSSVCAIFMMPLNLFIYIEIILKNINTNNNNINYNIPNLIISMGIIVIGTITGLFMGYYKYSWTLYTEKIAQLSMILLIIGTFISNSLSDTPLWEYDTSIYITIGLISFISFFFGFIVSIIFIYPHKSSIVSIAIETGLQNQILAIAIITLTFSDSKKIRDDVAGIPLLYGIISVIFDVIIVFLFFKCGWTDAQHSINKNGKQYYSVYKSFKIYQKERRMYLKNRRLNSMNQSFNNQCNTRDYRKATGIQPILEEHNGSKSMPNQGNIYIENDDEITIHNHSINSVEMQDK